MNQDDLEVLRKIGNSVMRVEMALEHLTSEVRHHSTHLFGEGTGPGIVRNLDSLMSNVLELQGQRAEQAAYISELRTFRIEAKTAIAVMLGIVFLLEAMNRMWP